MVARDKALDWVHLHVAGHTTHIDRIWKGGGRERVHTIEGRVGRRTRRGGQSALRIARNRDIDEHTYLQRVREYVRATFLQGNVPLVQGLVVTGTGKLHYQLHTMAPFTVAREVTDSLFTNDEDMQAFTSLFHQGASTIVYGREEVVAHYEAYLLKTVLVHPDVVPAPETVFTHNCTKVVIAASPFLLSLGGYAGILHFAV